MSWEKTFGDQQILDTINAFYKSKVKLTLTEVMPSDRAIAKASYEAGQKDGRQEVVGWIKANKMKLMQPAKMGCYQNVGKEELETKLKEWGLE